MLLCKLWLHSAIWGQKDLYSEIDDWLYRIDDWLYTIYSLMESVKLTSNSHVVKIVMATKTHKTQIYNQFLQ